MAESELEVDNNNENRQLPPAGVAERFSGHESFACRYGWLPKLYSVLEGDPATYRDDVALMMALGLGRNMVKSLRFWGTAFGIVAETDSGTVTPTAFGTWLLDSKSGADPYLESVSSSWLLHARLVARANLAAWNLVFSSRQETHLSRDSLRSRLERRLSESGRPFATSTIRMHLDVFLATYATRRRTRADQSFEDDLACPLQDLELADVVKAGDGDDLVLFGRKSRSTLSAPTLAWIVLDYWSHRAPDDRTLSFAFLLNDRYSPGLICRLDEQSLRDGLRELQSHYPRVFRFSESVERDVLELRTPNTRSACGVLGMTH